MIVEEGLPSELLRRTAEMLLTVHSLELRTLSTSGGFVQVPAVTGEQRIYFFRYPASISGAIPPVKDKGYLTFLFVTGTPARRGHGGPP